MKEIQTTSKLPTKPSTESNSSTVHASLLVLKYLLWGLFVFSGLVIASLNATPVVFNYFWNAVTLPLYLLLLLSFTTGCLIGIGFNLASHIKLHSYNRRLQQQNKVLKAEITRLRQDFSPERF